MMKKEPILKKILIFLRSGRTHVCIRICTIVIALLELMEQYAAYGVTAATVHVYICSVEVTKEKVHIQQVQQLIKERQQLQQTLV